LRVDLEKRGIVIGPLDMLIAAHALPEQVPPKSLEWHSRASMVSAVAPLFS
jgi:hypothetical protein